MLIGVLLAAVVAAAAPAAPDPIQDSIAAVARKDYAAAFQLIQPVAQAGNPRAEYMLGLLYANGQGVARDDAVSLDWERKSASQGFAPARDQVVNSYLGGRVKPQDYDWIAATCLALANTGDVKGEECLGFMYLHGHGVAADADQSLAWWKKAADQGSQVAETALGSTFERGHGVAQDFAQAAYWYGKTAELGNPFGMINLGVMASQGEGGAADEVEAYKWFDLAVSRFTDEASQARELAIRDRALSLSRLTPSQAADGQARIAAWKAAHPNLPPP